MRALPQAQAVKSNRHDSDSLDWIHGSLTFLAVPHNRARSTCARLEQRMR
jgi:hypothetical protein